MEKQENHEITMKSYCYDIAEHVMELQCEEDLVPQVSLPSFAGFYKREVCSEPTIRVVLTARPAPEINAKRALLSDVSLAWHDGFRFERYEGGYVVTIQDADENQTNWYMHSSMDFARATIYVSPGKASNPAVLSWLLMLVYGQAVISLNTLLIHASVVEKDGVGYAFLGKSGTGKSTHSRMWMTALEGVELLNDDNPAVRVRPDGTVWVYGTPWSGKTPCYRDRGVRLGGIVRLRQAPANRWKSRHYTEALAALLPSCTGIRWDRSRFDKLVDILEKVVGVVPVGLLECLPDVEAAALCYREIGNRENAKI